MTKIWREAFWKAEPAEVSEEGLPTAALCASIGLAVITVSLGVGAEALWSISVDAAAQLTAPDAYVRAVLEASS